MDGSQRPFFISHEFNKGDCDLSNPLLSKVLEFKGIKRRYPAQSTSTQESISSAFGGGRCMKMKTRSRTRFLMKRKSCLNSRGRRPTRPAANGIERKVRILKKLVPNSDSQEMDTLYQQTADYIIALQTRVKAMQIMVNLLSGSDHDEQN
ncbi:hypothetical protein ACH5RR_006763 [Cinchona calisaya]|uniref:Uncharacterized protein n=1 Tax=Cinchona calisaya TaxID=153742 RepID=A0ABD3APW0_9GENT